MGVTIERHKTAIVRNDYSRPIKYALSDGILNPELTFFDYGCGRGDDLRLLRQMGMDADGWDPEHRSESALHKASIVNIGYVVNVIEDPGEREETLKKAWSITERTLIVSARLVGEARDMPNFQEYGDGYITRFGTFQKFFEQHELRDWIEQTLGVLPAAAGPGVFYVFRDDEERIAFQATRYHRRIIAPRLTKSEELFAQNRELLQTIMDFYAKRGRLPIEEEIPTATDVIRQFGSIKRAFRVILRATEEREWGEIRHERSQETLIFLALLKFEKRPKLSKFPIQLQYDIKSFFTSYKCACELADDLLFSVGDKEQRNQALRASPVGKHTPNALYVHESGLRHLPPILRVYEACARIYIGRVDEANIIKLHKDEPKVSYLSYPDFDSNPHPALAFSLIADFYKFRVKYREYENSTNPPILHRKESFLHPEYPKYEKFKRLTCAEEKRGLYNNTAIIGTREGWEKILKEKGVALKGHRLIKSID